MDLKFQPQMFISDPNMCNRSTKITNVMDKQPMKNRHDLKPIETSDVTQESNKESTSELGVCIVLGVFRGWVNGMDSVITLI